MQNAELDESQTGIKIAGRNINNLRYADGTTLMAESKEPLDEGERWEWKSWHKTQFSSVQFSSSVVSDSLQPHGLQKPRPPCPSPTPRV